MGGLLLLRICPLTFRCLPCGAFFLYLLSVCPLCGLYMVCWCMKKVFVLIVGMKCYGRGTRCDDLSII